MNASKHSLRAAVLVTGGLAVAAVSNGCTASQPEQTAESRQAATLSSGTGVIAGGSVGTNPLQYAIINTAGVTGAVGTGGTCVNESIDVPTALQGYGCVPGIEIKGDPNLPGVHSTGSAYAWACSTNVPASVLVDGLNGTFGGPEKGASAIVNVASTTDACYGAPKPGWQVIVEFSRDYCPVTSITLEETLRLGPAAGDALEHTVDLRGGRYGAKPAPGRAPATFEDFSIGFGGGGGGVVVCPLDDCNCPVGGGGGVGVSYSQ